MDKDVEENYFPEPAKRLASKEKLEQMNHKAADRRARNEANKKSKKKGK